MLGFWACKYTKSWLFHLKKQVIGLDGTVSPVPVPLRPYIGTSWICLKMAMCTLKTSYIVVLSFFKYVLLVHSQVIQHGSDPICCQPQYDLSLYYIGQNVRISWFGALASQVLKCYGSLDSNSSKFRCPSRVCEYRCFICFFLTCRN